MTQASIIWHGPATTVTEGQTLTSELVEPHDTADRFIQPVTICLSGPWGVADTEWDPENKRTEITLYAVAPMEHEVEDWVHTHVCTVCDRPVDWDDETQKYVHV